VMNRIGQQLLNDSRAALNGSGEKGDNWMAKDLLSLLVRANMSKDLNASQKMSDADVLARTWNKPVHILLLTSIHQKSPP
jgi:hypothetical protein